jgi:virginiamycin B lyase
VVQSSLVRGIPLRIRVALASLLASLLLAATPGSASAYPPLADAQLFELAPSVHASTVAFAPDGSLWFAGAGYLADTTVVGRVSSTGEVSEFEVPGSSPGTFGASSIVAGPDGAMWFTEHQTNAIGRVDANGQMTRFVLPNEGGPNQIVAGPDGALWFTESDAGRVGRITTTGEISEFQLGRRGQPGGIAVGPDGALWVIETRANKIVRLTPAGERTTFALPPGIEPSAIVAGPGGLWFTEGFRGFGSRGANKLGRIAVDGTVKQFRVPARFGTGAIAAGPEGRIWFTTGPRRAAIESISATGKIGRRVCLEQACTLPPSSLAFAPDGTLWFGTQVYTCVYCGGGSGLMALQFPGNIGFLRSR